MPVTAKLSKAFYDRLGEQIANELVEWYNQVDATYRSDLEHLNEANFQRFSAHLDARVAASEAKLEVRMTAFESKIEQRIAAFESKIEQRIAALEGKLQSEMAALESKLQSQLAGVESRLGQRMAGLEVTLERRLGEQTRWLFVAWASLLIPIIGLWLRG